MPRVSNRKKTLDRPAGLIIAASKAEHCRIMMAKGHRLDGQPTLRTSVSCVTADSHQKMNTVTTGGTTQI